MNQQWHNLVGLLIILWVLSKDIREYQQSDSQPNQGKREACQKPSESNDAPGRNLGKLGSSDKNLRLLGSNQCSSSRMYGVFGNTRNFLAMLLNLFLKLFGCHKSNGVNTQPIYFYRLTLRLLKFVIERNFSFASIFRLIGKSLLPV